MSKLKLLMAVSADGFVARGENDDMRWTGPADKFLFKLLTTASDQVLLAGSTTYDQMPPLPHRKLVRLTRKPCGLTLRQAAHFYGEAWLIGGPTIALEALSLGLVERAYISRVPVSLGAGISFRDIQAHLPEEKIALRGDHQHLKGVHLTAYLHLNQRPGDGA
jgi:dihydrofolate reductase